MWPLVLFLASSFFVVKPELSAGLNFQKFLEIAASSRGKVSEDCVLTLDILQNSLNETYRYSQSSRWAYKLLDSMMKISPGIMLGGFATYGSFDECLDVKADFPAWEHLHTWNSFNRTIHGQYCPVFVKITADNESFLDDDLQGFMKEIGLYGIVEKRFDLCMPSTCSVQDNIYLLRNLNTAPFKMEFSQMICYSKGPYQVTIIQIFAISLFVLLGILLILGTALDLSSKLRQENTAENYSDQEQSKTATRLKPSRLKSALLSFSLITNWNNLITVRESKGSLTAVHGVRFLCTTHILLAHSYVLILFPLMGNPFDILLAFSHFSFQAITNGGVSVKSFFFLSGLLVAYVTLTELKKHEKITCKFIVCFYFHRFWRLTPALFFVMLFVFIWPLLGSGPKWDLETAERYTGCLKYGWATLLYVQNLFLYEDMCIEHSWFLACDMQLYLISPLILMCLHRKAPLGLAVNSLFILGGVVSTALIGHFWNLIPAILYNRSIDNSKLHDVEIMLDTKPWNHTGEFGIGILLGFTLCTRKDYVIPKWAVILGWCLAVACNLSVMYGPAPWVNGPMPARWVGCLYQGTAGTAWSLGLAWMVFACVTGYGGIVNQILSWKLFVPLSRISYMTYLIHIYVIFSFTGLLRERVIYTAYFQVLLYLGFLTLSLGLALVGYLAVEAPFVAVEKVLFQWNPTSLKQDCIPLKPEGHKSINYGLNTTNSEQPK